MRDKIKGAILITLALGAALVLAPPPPSHRKHPEREPVVFWHMWSGEWQPVVEKIVSDFNKSQTAYEVIPLSVPPAGAETKFLLTAGGRSGPDLVSQWNPVQGTWSERKLIQPIENVMTPEEKKAWLAEAYPIMKRHAMYKGKIMAIIAGVDVSALYYRLDHLREVGRDENSLPTTLEEVVSLGRQLDRKDKDGKLRRIGYLPQYWTSYVPVFGGSFGTSEAITIDTPPNRRALEFIAEARRFYGSDKIERFLSSQAADAGANAPLIAGNFSIILDGQWRVKQTAQFAPDLEYAVTPLPPRKGGKAMASMTSANYMMIPSASKCPKGAWEFLKFWVGVSSAEDGGRNTAAMGWVPYCDRVKNSKSYQAYLKKYPRFMTFVDLISSPNLELFPASPLQSFAMAEVTKADDGVSRGLITPDEAIRRTEQAVRAERARQRRLGNVR